MLVGYIAEAQRTLRLGKQSVVGKFEQVIQFESTFKTTSVCKQKDSEARKGALY